MQVKELIHTLQKYHSKDNIYIEIDQSPYEITKIIEPIGKSSIVLSVD